MIYSWLRGSLAVLCIIIITLACTGAVLAFLPSSQLNVFGGSFDVLPRTNEGGLLAWWSQHDEHRILFARAFFWLDDHLFGGSGIFLRISNLLLVVAATGLFVWAWRWSDPASKSARDVALFALCIGALLLLWPQHENLIGLGQGAFLLAHVFPLAALLLLARCEAYERWSLLWFAAAVLVGLASIGTMASGLLIQPFLLFVAILLRMNRVKIGVLAAVAALGLWAYFHDFVIPEAQASIGKAILQRPLDPVVYVLRYLGSPIYWILGQGQVSAILSTVAGATLIAAAAISGAGLLKSEVRTPVATALILFVGYVIATAILAAIGGAIHGVEHASSSRHTTSVLMAWVALFVIYMPALSRMKRNNPDFGSPFLTLSVALFAGLALYQLEAIWPASPTVDASVVAAEMQGRAPPLPLAHRTD